MAKVRNRSQRCREFLDMLARNALLRQGDPLAELLAFIDAEMGRTADRKLENTLSLILYFANDADRDECIAAFREVKPGMITKKIP